MKLHQLLKSQKYISDDIKPSEKTVVVCVVIQPVKLTEQTMTMCVVSPPVKLTANNDYVCGVPTSQTNRAYNDYVCDGATSLWAPEKDHSFIESLVLPQSPFARHRSRLPRNSLVSEA